MNCFTTLRTVFVSIPTYSGTVTGTIGGHRRRTAHYFAGGNFLLDSGNALHLFIENREAFRLVPHRQGTEVKVTNLTRYGAEPEVMSFEEARGFLTNAFKR